MAIKIAAWNVEGRLHGYQKSGRGTADQILSNIALLDADVLVLPEFYMNSLAPGVETRLERMGYEVYETKYNDVGRNEAERKKWGTVHIGIASRLPVSRVEVIRPGNVRNLLTCQVKDEETGKSVRIIATHLDDRTEALRLRQVQELVKIINDVDTPTVMTGDFNAMWRAGLPRLLRTRLARFAAGCIPWRGLRSVVVRASEMAKGTTLEELTVRTHLRDADPRRRPTTTPKMRDMPYLPSVRMIQIDHMLISPEIRVGGFKISKDGGSDHRAISASLAIGDNSQIRT